MARVHVNGTRSELIAPTASVAYGAVPLTALAGLGDHLPCAVAGFRDDHAELLMDALAAAAPALRPARPAAAATPLHPAAAHGSARHG